jgi:hypothetical protein
MGTQATHKRVSLVPVKDRARLYRHNRSAHRIPQGVKLAQVARYVVEDAQGDAHRE